jgi:hypothetical protein
MKIHTTTFRRPHINRTYVRLQLSFRVVDGPCNKLFLSTLHEHQGQWYMQNHIWKIRLLRLMHTFLLLFYYKALHKHLQNHVLNEQTKPLLLQPSWLWHRVVLQVISNVSNEPVAWFESWPVHRLTRVFLCFYSSPPGKWRDSNSMKPRWLPFKSFPMPHWTP